MEQGKFYKVGRNGKIIDVMRKQFMIILLDDC